MVSPSTTRSTWARPNVVARGWSRRLDDEHHHGGQQEDEGAIRRISSDGKAGSGRRASDGR